MLGFLVAMYSLVVFVQSVLAATHTQAETDNQPQLYDILGSIDVGTFENSVFSWHGEMYVHCGDAPRICSERALCCAETVSLLLPGSKR